MQNNAWLNEILEDNEMNYLIDDINEYLFLKDLEEYEMCEYEDDI